ncbi:cyclic nucleotide-binding domain-containing protein [Panacagrimonas sp.]|uniref:cyclic nucleotide-binding domain-containing protein n=1 Tax=Panacagrimonas sp. TaxID=2480088 RepID=UPI003B52B6B5
MIQTIAEKIARDPAMQALFSSGLRRQYPRQHVLLPEGSRPSSLYLLMAGTLAVSTRGKDGEDLLLAYFHPGDFFGEMGLFPDVSARSACIQTRTECSVLEIGYDRFLNLTRTHPTLWIEVASQLAFRLRAVNRRLAEMPTLHAADRIWLVLQELALRADAPHVAEGKLLRVTRLDLGKLAGCTRELAGMVLRDLATDGRVILRGQNVIVRTDALTPAQPVA